MIIILLLFRLSLLVILLILIILMLFYNFICILGILFFRFVSNNMHFNNMIEKGYVAIDGTSLTVNEINKNLFKVSFIPHTLKETTFKNLKINQYVNVETDVNARYIKKYVEDIMQRK